jgi:predicted nucleic acid-binding protein
MKSSTHELVINTGPVIALAAATDSLLWLASLYQEVWMPHEVYEELSVDPIAPESALVLAAESFIHRLPESVGLPISLTHELDRGEASVIHTALARGISTVAIDEKSGRRVARLHGLNVTGSLGILVRARKEGVITSLRENVLRMRAHGIWLSDRLIQRALDEVGERE